MSLKVKRGIFYTLMSGFILSLALAVIAQDFDQLARFFGGLSTDTISEVTAASGVTVDGVLIKDGAIATGTWSGTAIEGTAIASTGEVGGTKYLREDGDGTCSWQTVAGGGDVTKVGTPADSQIGVWTGDGTIEGDADFTFDTATNTLAVAGSADTSIVSVGGANIFVDNPRGTMTLSNVDAIDATTETTLEAAIDSLANLTTIGTVTSGTLSTGAVVADVTMTLGSDADGDIYYRSSNKLTRLAKGTASQVLTMNAGATAPEWAAPSGGGGFIDSDSVKTDNYTVLDTDPDKRFILGRATAADKTFTLPTLSANLNENFYFKNVSSYLLTIIGEQAATDAVEAGTTTTNITATGHSAVVGQIFNMTSGDEAGETRRVTAIVDVDNFTISPALSGTPSATETFELREAIDGEYSKILGYGESLGVRGTDDTNDEWTSL